MRYHTLARSDCTVLAARARVVGSLAFEIVSEPLQLRRSLSPVLELLG